MSKMYRVYGLGLASDIAFPKGLSGILRWGRFDRHAAKNLSSKMMANLQGNQPENA